MRDNKKSITHFVLFTLTLLMGLILQSQGWAATYYVDTDSKGGQCSNSGPGTLNTPWCTIGKANNTLSADDTVYIRAGTYNETISPDNSGSPGKYITYKPYGNEQVTITSVSYGANLANRSYVVVDGIRIINVSIHWVQMVPNSHHNTIKNCYMSGANGYDGIRMRAGANYNQILNNTCIATVYGPSDVIHLKDDDGPGGANYNLIENNTVINALHMAINLEFSDVTYNVVRNNTLTNQWHTTMGIYYQIDGGRNLIESNEIYDAATAESPVDGHNLQLGVSNYNIIRYNKIRGSKRSGMTLLAYGGGTEECKYNHIYNNTYYDNVNGIHQEGSGDTTENIFKNNLFWANAHDIQGSLNGNYLVDNTWSNGSNPQFLNPPNDLSLQTTSPMINAGTALTVVASADTGSGTTLRVDDAAYFQDGWNVPGVDADWIAVGSVTNVVQISSINYATNTITLTNSIARNDADSVWLYKNSMGNIVLLGSAPDIGALESNIVPDTFSKPRNLRILSVSK